MMTYTVAEAERILAEAKAREAAVDYDLERAVISACDAAYREVYGDNVPKLDTPYVKAFVRNFTLPLAPAQPSPAPSEEDDLLLARDVIREWLDVEPENKGHVGLLVLAAIRAERKRAGGVKATAPHLAAMEAAQEALYEIRRCLQSGEELTAALTARTALTQLTAQIEAARKGE